MEFFGRSESVPVKRIPLMTPYVPEEAKTGVMDTLNTRWIGQGPKVEAFESIFSQHVGRHAVAVGSCTDALHLAYMLAGIGPGDEVLVPLFTCTATNIPLLYMGARIRFVDVVRGGLNVSVHAIMSAISSATKAVVVVHYGGAPVEGLDGLSEYCRDRNIVLIEDCAQALGGSYYEKPLGSYGDFSCFSFQAVKHVCTGDGGMLIVNDPKLVEKAKRMRWFGIDRKAKLNGVWENDIWEVGYKYQMTDIAAAMGIAGMKYLDFQMKYRRMLREFYIGNLPDTVKIIDQHKESACWLLTVLVDRREDLRKKLLDNEIESDQVHYRNDRYSIFHRYRGIFPNMDAVDSQYLVLPMHMSMSVDDVLRVCKVIKSGW